MRDLFTQWQPILLVAVGVVSVVVGGLFRAGRLRAWAAITRNDSFPPHVRNSVFSLVPCGVVCLLWVGGIALHEAGGSAVLATYVELASVPVLLLAIWISARPPAWSKPAWLRAEDARVAAGGRRIYGGRPPELGPRLYALAWALLVAAVIVSIVVSAPVVAVGIGLAFAVPIIVAVRPRSAAEENAPPRER